MRALTNQRSLQRSKKICFANFHLYLVDEYGKTDSIARGSKNFGEYDGRWTSEHDRVRRVLHADDTLVVAAEVDFLPPNDGNAKAICKSALPGYEDMQQWATNISKLLMACSPVFRAMFTHPFAEESKSGIVKITDSKEPAPMRALLSYCYRGYLDAETMDGEWTVEIFSLACKYRIDDLKALMEKHYIGMLSAGNVVAMAVLADVYSADKLKEVRPRFPMGAYRPPCR